MYFEKKVTDIAPFTEESDLNSKYLLINDKGSMLGDFLSPLLLLKLLKAKYKCHLFLFNHNPLHYESILKKHVNNSP